MQFRSFILFCGVACLSGSLTVSRAQSPSHPSATVDCAKVTGSNPLSAKTERVTNGKRSSDAYATVEVANDPANSSKSCIVTYTLYLSQYSRNFHAVKTFSAPLHDSAGVDLIGFSDDDSKLAADFWWETGDYRAHRPVIYDVKTKVARISELGDQIIGQLPACAYSEEFVGVTDSGDAIIDVPASKHVEAGCPAQGKWLFDLRTDSATRMPPPHP